MFLSAHMFLISENTLSAAAEDDLDHVNSLFNNEEKILLQLMNIAMQLMNIAILLV